MKKLSLIVILFIFASNLFSQSDKTPESMLNQSSYRKVSGDESAFLPSKELSTVPLSLRKQYDNAVDNRNPELKESTSLEIEKYLHKAEFNAEPIDVQITKGNNAPFISDWYGSDVLVMGTDVASSGGYRQIDLKQGEDGWMYMAVNRRNLVGLNGEITVYRSSDGGSSWATVANVLSITGYFGSISMLVESRNNNIPDSTRILVYATLSASSNFNSAYLICSSFRRDGSASSYYNVASPSAGNRFVYPTACSDGAFWESPTYMHVIVREESNAGTFVNFHHFRSANWAASHTVGSVNYNTYEDRYPAAAFSNETGSDSIYVAFEREISNNEHEIRLYATSEIPTNTWSVRYITDAAPGTIYRRPAITIQQRYFSLPQRILVTCTKNNRAVYHFSTDGGAAWNIDFGLGPVSMPVDYTSCSSDTTEAGGKDFISSFVDLNGDSVTVRHGELGNMGTPLYKKNWVASTGVLAPVCAIYKEGNNKYAAFSYAGYGPTGVYYNMEALVTGITPVSNEIPSSFSLEQNYPNPFNPVTNIKFAIAGSGLVTLKVYDISGREVALLVNEELSAGSYNFDFNAAHLSSGIYFYRLTADSYTDTKKMILVK